MYSPLFLSLTSLWNELGVGLLLLLKTSSLSLSCLRLPLILSINLHF